jgi:catechol 2,3-dioxygenase-like lactoylglutathione lyase family enzyme
MESMVPGSMAAAASGGFTLEFQVTDVDARHERLLALDVEILRPPTTQPWGRRSVWLRDPDGNIVNLCQDA